MPIQMTYANRAESPAQRADGQSCADDSAWREKITRL
jgi:hypothetical protein